MSSKRNFQDFQLSEVSESRKKFDVQSLNPQHMQNHSDRIGHRGTDASLSESEFNLRKSLAWDSAFFTSPGVLDPEELEALSIRVVDDGVDTTGGGDMRSVPSQSAGPEGKSAIDECSLRRSLAWDSAFFTSSGVLNAEELSLVNGGFRLSQGHTLPGIIEVWRSAESNSTRNADAYSLASLEIDLFDNMRSSMQKSNDASSTRETSTRKVRRENEMQRGNTSKASDASSRLRGPNKESKLFLKPPQIFCQNRNLSAAPNKRASSGANHVKLEDTGAQVASGSLRRTINSQVSASKSRTPRQYSAGNIKELVNSSNSTCLLSTPKSSSCTSPASSTDGCSSESSSIILNPRSGAICASLQASSLRMPSPKIGFFDVGNSVDIAPNGVLKFFWCTIHFFQTQKRAGAKEPVCSQEKKQPLKELEVAKTHGPENKVQRFNEDNKENVVSFENQVDDLSRRMEGIVF
ncbi:hypothetical protein OIU74_021713 [Salix koriyanagi]|uniref:Uncharacterized protein n=1 Tax=Salix koriyanagi TaxID=2511006 RepID=A0A9Q0WII2_9ROSI|nr:hypothetical protein OIU74_021713 [Salix koriyanagi]